MCEIMTTIMAKIFRQTVMYITHIQLVTNHNVQYVILLIFVLKISHNDNFHIILFTLTAIMKLPTKPVQLISLVLTP